MGLLLRKAFLYKENEEMQYIIFTIEHGSWKKNKSYVLQTNLYINSYSTIIETLVVNVYTCYWFLFVLFICLYDTNFVFNCFATL